MKPAQRMNAAVAVFPAFEIRLSGLLTAPKRLTRIDIDLGAAFNVRDTSRISLNVEGTDGLVNAVVCRRGST
jgi:hypothetical protein